jgi:hypothetical protein
MFNEITGHGRPVRRRVMFVDAKGGREIVVSEKKVDAVRSYVAE